MNQKIISRILIPFIWLLFVILFPIRQVGVELYWAYRRSAWWREVKYEIPEMTRISIRDFKLGRLRETKEEKSARIKKAKDDL